WWTSACRVRRNCSALPRLPSRSEAARRASGTIESQLTNPYSPSELSMTTLYLSEPRSTVRKDGDTLLVLVPGNGENGAAKRTVRVPLRQVDKVVVLADSTLTTPALLALLEQNADICFCDFS